MKINYPSRSKFLTSCENVIRNRKDDLLNCLALPIHLSKEGYIRSVQVTISSSDDKCFLTDWKGSGPTRFSARIKTAAWEML